jgi:phenylacetic acid degradation operon negative regulatory protein
MDTYRRFPLLDPQLPVSLLPSGWLREPAAEAFAAVYDGLSEAAQDHVRAVAAHYTDNPSPGIAAHTVADLLAGVRQTHAPNTSRSGRQQSQLNRRRPPIVR